MKTRCAFDEMRPLESLVENPRNPNKHPPQQIKLLAKVLKSQGWRAPIVVSKRSGFIVKGHGRLQAAKLAGFKKAPVDLQDYANLAQEHADLVADNKLSELSEFDGGALKDIIEELDSGAFDLELVGFGEEELAALFSQFHVPEDGQTKQETMEAWVCPKCGWEDFTGKKAKRAK